MNISPLTSGLGRAVRKTRAGLVAFVVVQGVWGCDPSSREDGTAAPIPKEQLAEQAAQALCTDLGACCSAQGFAYDRAKCEARMRTAISTSLIEPAEAEGAAYDARAAGDCIASLRSAVSQCSFYEPPEACERIYSGVKAPGAACESDIGCAPAADGEVTCAGDAGQKACTVEPRGHAGDACSSTCTDHGDGTACSSSGQAGPAVCWTNDGLFCNDAGSCAQLANVGQACSGESCVSDAFCNAEGVCAARVSAGEACGQAWDACGSDLYCSDAGVCTPLKAVGDACESFRECEGGCVDGSCGPSGDTYVSPEFCSGA